MPLPAVPGARVAYQDNGCAVVGWQDGIWGPTTFGYTTMVKLNGTDGGAFDPAPTNSENVLYLACVFPQLRDLKGVFASGRVWQNATAQVWTSADTTTGVDGTWTNSTVTFSANGAGANTASVYRENITAVSVSGVKGVRLQGWQPNYSTSQQWVDAFHVYADVLATTVTDRVQFWHPTLDQPLSGTDFDFGDVPRGSASTKQFRIKNVSSTLTANTVDLAIDAATDSSPSLSTVLNLSDDDISYGTTLNLGNLSAGALSSVLYARYVVTDTFPLGAWAPHIVPSVGSWS